MKWFAKKVEVARDVPAGETPAGRDIAINLGTMDPGSDELEWFQEFVRMILSGTRDGDRVVIDFGE